MRVVLYDVGRLEKSYDMPGNIYSVREKSVMRELLSPGCSDEGSRSSPTSSLLSEYQRHNGELMLSNAQPTILHVRAKS